VRKFGILFVSGLAIASACATQDPAREGLLGARTGPPQPIGRNVRAQPCDYFPLATGNLWIYRGSGVYAATFLTLEIAKTQVFQGVAYFLLNGFPQQDYWLREDGKGSVLQYDPSQATEKLWWAFNSPLGQQYSTDVPGACCRAAMVASRSAAYQGPLGTFDSALQISYPGVFQVGIIQETFLPGIGLALRTQATGGPSYGSWDLIYARVGGVTVDSAPELSFGIALDNSIYAVNMMPPVSPATAAPLLTARLRLRNTARPITIDFPSGQSFDFTITNDKGAIVYRWSDGQAFPMIVRTETFGPGERDFVIQLRLNGPDKAPLPAGNYVAEGWLTTMGAKVFDASAPFQVAWVY
jgi:hypothetical protein